MSEMPLALLVTNRANWASDLKLMLERRGFAVYEAANCAEAALLLHSYAPPQVVFTDMQLADGSWTGILSLAETSPLASNVIVVSPVPDIESYVATLERGAFDFVVPPFDSSEINHVARCAMGNANVRRQLQRSLELEDSQRDARPSSQPTLDDDLEVAASL
jgi:DNA-binding NtrC family response regulator